MVRRFLKDDATREPVWNRRGIRVLESGEPLLGRALLVVGNKVTQEGSLAAMLVSRAAADSIIVDPSDLRLLFVTDLSVRH